VADVAVLTPAYNGLTDVRRTLASFDENATIYALVVADGSAPHIVAAEVPGMCVEVLRMPKNGGIERALQAAIEALAALGTWTQVVNRAGEPLFMLRPSADARAAPHAPHALAARASFGDAACAHGEHRLKKPSACSTSTLFVPSNRLPSARVTAANQRLARAACQSPA